MASKNTALGEAKANKKDEFYTQLSDIEKELKYYRKHFKDKVVLCNCDDPFESNFFKYFVLNFNKLGLRKLIATSYATSPIAGTQFSYHIDENGQMSFAFGGNNDNAPLKKAYNAVVNTVYDKTGNDAVEMLDVAELFGSGENELTELNSDGDFRSDECIELLKEADIVCTNPPFSLFREYVALLMEYDKKFVIIGTQNAITYKEIFPLLKENKIWLGVPFQSGNAYFYIPEGVDTSQYAKGVYDPDTRRVKFRNCCWFTNLDIKKRHEEMILVKKYNPRDYPQYANYDAIEVSKMADIPCNYDGKMGVPITFLNKYNPDQFEIIGLTCCAETMDIPVQLGEEFINNYRSQGGTGHFSANMYGVCYYDENGRARVPYGRILIHNKHPEQPKGDS